MKSQEQAYLDVSLRLPIGIPSVKQRLDRAMEQVLAPGYQVAMVRYNPSVYLISKESTSVAQEHGVTYTVTAQDCTCPDFQSAYGSLCKHRLAVMILEEMER